MRKRKVLSVLSLAGLALSATVLASCNQNNSGIDVYMPNTNGEVVVGGKAELYFKQDSEIPYISVDEATPLLNTVRASNLDDKDKYYVKSKVENKEYIIYNERGAKCVLNPDKQTITYDDYDKFTSVIPDTQEPLSLVLVKNTNKALKVVKNEYTKGSKTITHNLNNYSMLNMFVENGKCYLPLSVFNTVLFNTGDSITLSYNGKSLFLIPGNSLSTEIAGISISTPLCDKFHENAEKESISKEFSDYYYQSLCFDFDAQYGLRDKFTTFDAFLEGQGKSHIQTTDPKDIDLYTGAALTYLNDGHTALSESSYLYPTDEIKINRDIVNQDKLKLNQDFDAFSKAKSKAKLADGIQYIDDTAFLSFSTFNAIDQSTLYDKTTDKSDELDDFTGADDIPGIDFASTEIDSVNALDTAVLFHQLYADLKSDTYKDKIKNVVIDLTTNLGGSADSLLYSLCTTAGVNGEIFIDMTNPLSGGHNHQVYKADINADGSIDDKDKSLADLGFNVYFLDSKYSFSSGNALPVAAKLNNSKVKTLGATTGGGPCAVRAIVTTIGSMLSTSSLNTISKPITGGYANIDDGVKADYALTESQMIDRSYIVSGLKNGFTAA